MKLYLKHKIVLLLTVTVLSIVTVFFFPPISQDPLYHCFADDRTVNSIPNCYNVISNALFLIIGGLGIIHATLKTKGASGIGNLFFFIGVLLTGLGSSYYHLTPDNESLLWDRLPMTISFMSFFSFIISEHIDERAGKRIVFHFIFLGISSVLYWYMTELLGKGDLRFYAIVQFLPLLLIPLIIALFKTKTSKAFLVLMLLSYATAKLCEGLDKQIYEATHFVSGHTLKHLFASMAPLFFLLELKRRVKIKGSL